MAEVKVSALTALTGANVANGDELYIVDTGSPNVSKKITADELAQMPQLSSRYVPLASDRIWIPAQNLTAVFNTPAMGTLGNATYEDTRQPVLLFDASTTEYAATTWFTPPGWATYDLYLWWSNAGAGSGNVFWGTTVLDAVGDAETTDSGSYLGNQIITAPAQYVAKQTKLNSSARSVTVGEFNKIVLIRAAADVLDTLGNDAGVIGLEVVRAS